MNVIKKTLASLLIVTVSAPALAWDWNVSMESVSDSYMTGALTNGKFNNTAFKPVNPQPLEYTEINPKIKDSMNYAYRQDGHTLAMLVMERGKVVFERNSEEDNTEYMSWSMSKSITGMLVGMALCQGDIKSLDERADSYVPEIKGSSYGNATIKQLLTMRSGAPVPGNIGTGESRGDFFDVTRGTKSITDLINRTQGVGNTPEVFHYDNLSIDTLSLVLDKRKGTKFYMEQLLANAGVESESHWLLDKDNHIHASYGYGATLRDWAHLGNYTLNVIKGRTNNPCLTSYMKDSIKQHSRPEESDIPRDYLPKGYGYAVWLHPNVPNTIQWIGNYGQKMYINLDTEQLLITFRNKNNPKYNTALGHTFWVEYKGLGIKDKDLPQSQITAVQGSVIVEQATKAPKR